MTAGPTQSQVYPNGPRLEAPHAARVCPCARQGYDLVLYRRDLARSLRPGHAAARSNPTLLLMLRVRGNPRVADRLAATVVLLRAAHMIPTTHSEAVLDPVWRGMLRAAAIV